jgi:RNA polymerase sigma factor for flagellar operon FliA
VTEPRRASKHRLPDADALALQTEYRRTGDSRLRDRLVIAYAGIVKHIVYRKLRELPAWCEVDDLLSCGLEALIAAVDRFDPERGATFEQYAWTRVHGAVLDELRRQDWAPRPLRRWERDIAKAREHFVVIHRRRPSEDELADAMGIDRDHLDRLQQDLQASDLTSLNTLVLDEEDSQVERIDTILSDSAELDPERATERTLAKEKFRRAFARLTERERELAVLLYVKNLTLREIGEVLGVSESRVCRLHARLKQRLRDALQADEARLGPACRGGRVLSRLRRPHALAGGSCLGFASPQPPRDSRQRRGYAGHPPEPRRRLTA